MQIDQLKYYIKKIIGRRDAGFNFYEFEKSINILAGNQFKLWGMLIELIKAHSRRTTEYLTQEYFSMQSDRMGEFFMSEKLIDFTVSSNKSILDEHAKKSIEKRNQIRNAFVPFPIENCAFISELSRIPIVIHEALDTKESGKLKLKGKTIHLFVLVHGYMGSSNDLRIIKGYLSLNFPGHKFLCSKQNEADTNSSIFELGKNLASEVQEYIRDEFIKDGPTKISFIGHSLGGIIIRAALPNLSIYKDKMHLYMSISSPHLGLTYNSNSLVSTGYWFMKNFTSSKSLQQLSLSDDPIMEKTALFRLSNTDGLEWFSYVMLASSHNDCYVPFESARIELNEKVFKDAEHGAIFIKMAQNIFGKIKGKCLNKLDVDFQIKKKQIDKMIGRAAHIEFLDNEYWIQVVLSRLQEIFE